ncbi:beta-ketoacyl synthase N-terminal-like domain-containing protein [Paraburkholderia hayleyella]|uniref:beta-ketoacyl synthase N-terminal-like domain-containing protein n=1 Tax=Paraburkholderia hayleyella TaxID=2152889 RepID=UPI001580B880|nr:beta-ketoacyl synthase N-terminal-like domain-containing protein [Paraburkholderia hayleyella]
MLETPIAIVGMDCRLPGAASVAQFWENLRNKKSGILRLAGAAEAGVYLAAGYLDNADRFDYPYFKLGKREASMIDPQHRLFLTCASGALESVKKHTSAEKFSNNRVGVFASCPMNTYLPYTRNPVDTSLHTLEGLQSTLQNDKDYISLRTANILNLQGPAINVQASCSSSIVAAHLACLALAAKDCDVALVGGASVMTPQLRPYRFVDGSIFSADGHCRPFTEKANGTVHGNGAAVVVLKRLKDAIRDKDAIFGVIVSSAINNDGNRKDGFTAPSAEGQREVIERALEHIDVETIGLVEAHGTGTRLGDRIEIEGLTKAFSAKSKKKGYCGLGTVKAHIGHLEAVSGAASLIKVALSLSQKQIASDIYDAAPVDFSDTPFYVPPTCTSWNSENGKKRRASISSFGMGGTNAHMVIEEPPAGLEGHIGSLPEKKSEQQNLPMSWMRPTPENTESGLGMCINFSETEVAYETLINIHSYEWLKDHLLAEAAVVPGTYFINLFKSIAFTFDHNIVWKLNAIDIKKSLTVNESRTVLRINAQKNTQGWKIQIESRAADGWESVVHATAEAVPSMFSANDRPHLSDLLKGKQVPLRVEDIYAGMNVSSGMYHGPHFQKVRHAVETPLGVLGVIADFEDHLKEPIDREVCLLDSCLQLFRFAHGQKDAHTNSGYLLTGIESIDLPALSFRKGQGMWCLAQRRPESVGNSYITDFLLFSEDSDPVGEIRGAHEKALGGRSSESKTGTSVPVQKEVMVGDRWSRERLISVLKSIVADAIGKEAENISQTDSLEVLGMDSFSILELSLVIDEKIGQKIDSDDVERHSTVETIADRLAIKLNG